MKIVTAVARYLLGLMFLVLGLNSFFNFLPQPPLPPGHAGEFLSLLMTTHYVYAVGAVMVISAILLLVNQFVVLALVLLGPVLVNVLLYHVLMQPKTIGLGVFATLLWLLVAYRVRGAFAPLFQARTEG
ncbi:MAG TPA: hypothetical protein VGG56_01160 [Terracidiphilus sp.]|jgi:hypothetical protein